MTTFRPLARPRSIRPQRTPLWLRNGIYRFVTRHDDPIFARFHWTPEKLASLARANAELYTVSRPERRGPALSSAPAFVARAVDPGTDPQGFTVHDLLTFYTKAELVSVNFYNLSEDIRFQWTSLTRPSWACREDEDPRHVFETAAEWFAERMGTNEIVAKSTAPSLAAAKRKLVADMVAVAEANGIDIEEPI